MRVWHLLIALLLTAPLAPLRARGDETAASADRAAPEATPPPQPSEVYYQVAFADGRVGDLPAVPTTNEGIRYVVRIARYRGGEKPMTIYSTRGPAVTVVNDGRTVRTQLKWDGKAWVAPGEGKAHRAADATRPAKAGNGEKPAKADPLAEELARLNGVIGELNKKLAAADHAVAQARRDIAAAEARAEESTPAATARHGEALAEARARQAAAEKKRQAALEALALYRRQRENLDKLAAADGFDAPAGEVRALKKAPPAEGALGCRRQVKACRKLDHRTQVWKLPAGRGRRSYTVGLAHPAAGYAGALRYVAYADTNGDGLPDKLLATSPLARATAAGQWTQWQFSTDQPHVYVGCALPQWRPRLYGQAAESPRDIDADWTGLSREIYVSGFYGGMPTTPKLWPYLSNIRVRLNVPDPDVTE